ncbi:RES family NAD+ phosphorylase [uncultured Flavobacterium sp.]|uniref:RES family NAD+ phosphorylase n=1 Tax=uncultured Flavobacterium sp. TaxID=165435 RepID=UPI0025DD121E|nr:RES family NAD+ phosphorylase [uncultured Flavobacterium sp.]
MVVYRIGRTKYAHDLTGEGARLHGGRWNHVLVPCVYTSQSRALSLLELTVNVNIDEIPRALSITTIELPDDAIKELALAELPGDWDHAPSPTSTKDLGSRLLKSVDFPILKIPSAILPQEFNYILNPLHPASAAFKIISVQDFVYDVRIKYK